MLAVFKVEEDQGTFLMTCEFLYKSKHIVNAVNHQDAHSYILFPNLVHQSFVNIIKLTMS